MVDDSITTRTMEKNILETQGYEVAVAVSGEEALATVAERDFDLVVSDVEMPGIDGFELTRRLRRMERYADVPVIIVTSLASDEHLPGIKSSYFDSGLVLEQAISETERKLKSSWRYRVGSILLAPARWIMRRG